jgi:hypothetical protein
MEIPDEQGCLERFFGLFFAVAGLVAALVVLL